jgi:crossover junction endodeoxyribonuclease RuvC
MIVGIDPGVDGAIAWMTDGGDIEDVRNMPTTKDGKKRIIDCPHLCEVLKLTRPDIVVLESVNCRPGQGVSSVFSFGRSLGRIEGVIHTLGLPIEFPTPQRWKKVVLEGTDKSKEAAIAYVQRRWPDAQLIPDGCRVPHDGRADSILLAEFGRRLMGGRP